MAVGEGGFGIIGVLAQDAHNHREAYTVGTLVWIFSTAEQENHLRGKAATFCRRIRKHEEVSKDIEKLFKKFPRSVVPLTSQSSRLLLPEMGSRISKMPQ